MTAAIDPWAVIAAVFPDNKPEPARTTPVIYKVTAAGSGYAQRALENEAQRVVDAPSGTRNHSLNRAAFSLGQLVAGGALEQDEVVHALTLAAHQAGLEDDEIAATLRSGLLGGQKEPRGVPEQPDVDDWLGKATSPAPAGVDPETGEVVEDDPEAALSARIRERLPTLDWTALWADESEEEWIVEPLLPARRLVALYSAPKVGKSLLLLELCVGIATGRPTLGNRIDRPRRVLYVDFENDPKADIRERLQAMGVGPADLGRLHYLSFPTLSALDSDLGGRELMAAVTEYECEVVVIDTVSRSIAGEENENDTWLSFYRHTGLRMKQAGVALIRLDHSGKDESKGQRGGSAKSGDVDAVWRMSRLTDDSFRLDCEAARMPIAEKVLVLHRQQHPLRHNVDAAGRSASVEVKKKAAWAALDAAGLPFDASRDRARPVLKNARIRLGNDALGELMEARKLRGPQAEETRPEPSGRTPDGGPSAWAPDDSGRTSPYGL